MHKTRGTEVMVVFDYCYNGEKLSYDVTEMRQHLLNPLKVNRSMLYFPSKLRQCATRREWPATAEGATGGM